MQALNQLSHAGLPVVQNYGITTVNGKPAILMENVSGGITIKPAFNDPAQEAIAFSNLNSNSVLDLQAIQGYLKNNTIGDFQVMVTPQGRVLLNDPGKIGAAPTEPGFVTRLVEDMLDIAMKRK